MERSPKTLVVDASAATKWFVEETDSEKALLLKTAYETGKLQLTAPDLIVYEVTNALNYNPGMTRDEVVLSTRRLLDLDLDLVPPRADYIAETARTARKYSISAYDACYVALADAIGTSLVTADGKLFRKLEGKRPLLLLASLGKGWSIPGG